MKSHYGKSTVHQNDITFTQQHILLFEEDSETMKDNKKETERKKNTSRVASIQSEESRPPAIPLILKLETLLMVIVKRLKVHAHTMTRRRPVHNTYLKQKLYSRVTAVGKIFLPSLCDVEHTVHKRISQLDKLKLHDLCYFNGFKLFL